MSNNRIAAKKEPKYDENMFALKYLSEPYKVPDGYKYRDAVKVISTVRHLKSFDIEKVAESANCNMTDASVILRANGFEPIRNTPDTVDTVDTKFVSDKTAKYVSKSGKIFRSHTDETKAFWDNAILLLYQHAIPKSVASKFIKCAPSYIPTAAASNIAPRDELVEFYERIFDIDVDEMFCKELNPGLVKLKVDASYLVEKGLSMIRFLPHKYFLSNGNFVLGGSDEVKNFYKNMSTVIALCGQSMLKFCDMIGVPWASMYKLRNAARIPHEVLIEAISRITGVSDVDLFLKAYSGNDIKKTFNLYALAQYTSDKISRQHAQYVSEPVDVEEEPTVEAVEANEKATTYSAREVGIFKNTSIILDGECVRYNIRGNEVNLISYKNGFTLLTIDINQANRFGSELAEIAKRFGD